MAVHVDVDEAKTRLSQLIAAALRGEEVVLDKDGTPQVRLVPVESLAAEERARRAAKRASAFGRWAKEFEDFEFSIEDIKQEREYSEGRRNLYGDDLR